MRVADVEQCASAGWARQAERVPGCLIAGNGCGLASAQAEKKPATWAGGIGFWERMPERPFSYVWAHLA